jgi:RNase adaptor protein for sRNA GlmZ degradation
MNIRLLSTGKASVLGASLLSNIDADCYIDCRVVRNPHRDPAIGHLTGDSKEVQAWMAKENPEFLRAAVKLIELGVQTAPTRNSFKAKDKPFTVAFFCLAGVHRSRSAKHIVGNILKQKGYQVEVA